MKIRPDLSTLLDVPGMARAKRENEELRAALARVTAELVEARRLAALVPAFAAEYDRLARIAIRCHQIGDTAEARRVAAQQRVWRAASDLAREHAEKTAEDLARATEQARNPESAA